MRKSLSITFVSKFLSALLNLYIITLLSRELGAEGKGLCSLLITIISVGQVFCDIVGGAAFTYLASRVNFKKLLFQTYLWIFIVCFFVQGFAFLQFEKISVFFIHIFALNFLNAAIGTHQNIFIGIEKYKTSALLGFLQVFILSVVLYFFLKIETASISSYIMALYISWTLIFAVGFILILVEKLPTTEKMTDQNIISVSKYGFINQFAHILQFINLRLSYFLLPAFALGVYSNATSVAESLWLIGSSFASIIYGSVSNNTEKEKNISITIRSIKAVMITTILGSLVMLFIPTSFYVWLFGVDFIQTNKIIIYLIPGIVFFGIYLIPGHYFSGTGQFMKNIWCIGTGLLITSLCIAIIFISGISYTPILAALVTSASYFGNMLVALIIFHKETNTSFRNLVPNKEDLIWIKSILIRH